MVSEAGGYILMPVQKWVNQRNEGGIAADHPNCACSLEISHCIAENPSPLCTGACPTGRKQEQMTVPS
jgi:hypothetical protein